MEVSAIGPTTARQIDWRRLTAKEILKYEEQGVQVPDQYLQWAKSFLNDLAAGDQDETTYEMAQAAGATANATSQNNVNTENPEESENPENMSANEKKNQMIKEGKGGFEIALAFKAESAKRGAEAESAGDNLNNLGQKSDDAIAQLDGYMSDLMGQIGELKEKIDSAKSGGNKDRAGEIKRLQKELERCGYSGQNVANAYTNDLKQYQTDMDSLSQIIDGAMDYGSMTKEIGANIKRKTIFTVLGYSVEKTGKYAIEKGKEASSTYNDVLNRNSDNLSDIVDYKRDIKAETGVSASEAADNGGNEQNPEQQQADAASATFDTIVQAKVKQNENVNS